MLKNILNKFENPQYPLLGPNIAALKFWGLLQPDNLAKKCLYLFLHCNLLLFILSECVEIWFIRYDMNFTLTNLKLSILSAVTVSKIVTFLLWQKDWKSILNYVTETDKIRRNDEDDIKDIIDKYTKYCRKITYAYSLLMYTTVLVVVSQPPIKYMVSNTYRENANNGIEDYSLPVSNWMPFNKNTLIGHILTCIYIDYAAIYGGNLLISFDTSAIVIMVFFRGELEMLKIESSKICEANISKEKFRRRLQDCYARHVKLMKYARKFDSCLSPIMLLYVIVSSGMLCATVYQLNVETSMMQKLVTAEYLMYTLAQLFMYCWHSNDVFYVSKNLSRGPYESVWWTRSVPEQRNISLLVAQFSKVILFSAGPFSNITIATFITIVKGAYSYYTVLSQPQQD